MTITDLDAAALDKIADRFWPRVASFEPDECWQWPGTRGPTGYGSFSYKVKGRTTTTPAHRMAYMLTHRAIGDGLEIDHLCSNRACVNPAHLEAVTHVVNVRRSDDRHFEMHRAGKECGWVACRFPADFFLRFPEAT